MKTTTKAPAKAPPKTRTAAKGAVKTVKPVKQRIPKILAGVIDRDFIRVGRSRIQGTGVFAKRKIPQGSRIIEYLGKRIPISKFVVQLSQGKPINMYAFRVSNGTVIDGGQNGNDARFFNHSCEPNCEAFVFDDRAYLYAMRDIVRGEELTFDYKLQSPVERKPTKQDKEMNACYCGSQKCRGTMIATRTRASK
jgi:SET domain-containing protein